VTYLAYLGLLISGFAAAGALQQLLNRRGRRPGRRLSPPSEAFLSLLLPGLGALLNGRLARGSFLLGGLLGVLFFIPLPPQMVGVPLRLLVGPFWLLSWIDALGELRRQRGT